MTAWMRRVAALIALLTLTGCGGMKAEQYADTTPRFLIEEYFAGNTRAWGIVQDRSGEVKRTFTVDIEGTPTEDGITLVERFVYGDGETETKTWTIRRTGPHGYEGETKDVVGMAKGEAYGNALNWTYDYRLTVGGRTWTVRFDDWMFLQPDGVLINRARIKKFGFTVAEVTIFFNKPRT